MKKVVIIIPTYNEAKNIQELVTKIFRVIETIDRWEIHVVVVDSYSPDGTEKVIIKLIKQYPYLHLLRLKKRGLGVAYLEGFKTAIEKLQPYLLFEMDADLSHDPNKIPQFLSSIEAGADFVIGSRYIKGGSIPEDWGIHRKIFSFFGNLIVRLGFMKLKITDWTSGYRAIKVWVIKSIHQQIKSYSGYVFQIAAIDKSLKQGARIAEVPINFTDRKHGKSKINFSQYIFDIFLYIFLNSSFIKYVIVGISGFIIDFGLSYILIEKLRTLIWLATLISAESAIISNFFFNNFWSFSYKKLEGGLFTYLSSFLKFNFVSAGALIIQAVGIQLLVNIFGRKLWYVYKTIILIFIIIPYSYVLYNKVIWKEK